MMGMAEIPDWSSVVQVKMDCSQRTTIGFASHKNGMPEGKQSKGQESEEHAKKSVSLNARSKHKKAQARCHARDTYCVIPNHEKSASEPVRVPLAADSRKRLELGKMVGFQGLLVSGFLAVQENLSRSLGSQRNKRCL